jgi:dihydroorotase
VAAVGEKIAPAEAFKVVDASGLYVTPGLIDIHVHVYTGTGERNSYAGDNSVYPDGFTFRVGVTTVADAGGAGWRNFEAFKEHIIDRSRTRVLAFINIVGHGMRGSKFEQDLADMEAKPAADMAMRHKGLIVGVKTAHYAGPEWKPVEQAGRTSRHTREHSGYGGFRKQSPGASDWGVADKKAAARGHLYARALRKSE